ncbi:glycosyltransferase family 2 protein [Microbacterium kunmingense]|uniref:glycosyltransferase family 2 protein n=1 Tax=Microbacterium kunmingense TaxID=2915939 RepID=UPI002005E85A|nr:glycosyltransferase [Microbacterium kunmingense]
MESAALARFLIAISTYRRPDGLRRLLATVVESTARASNVDVLVVDNDTMPSAQVIAEEYAPFATYVHEPRPGIASARNRSLESFDERYEAIVFVDDDEWVDAQWWDALTSFATESGADVVQGPVLTIIPPGSPKWVRAGGFYQRPLLVNGTRLDSAATNNTLLRREAWVRGGCPRFDHAFSESGGSDWDLFWGLRRSGARILFCSDAVVSEDVPDDRLRWAWIRRRYIRNGMVGTRVIIKHGDSLVLYLLRASAVGAIGVAEVIRDLVLMRGFRARALSRVFVSIGKFAPLFGGTIKEYKRS